VPGPVRAVPPAIRYLLDALVATPAYVVSAKFDILAWNQLATYFIGDLSETGEDDRNMIRWWSSESTTRSPGRSSSSAR
jgi:hypothetical protein